MGPHIGNMDHTWDHTLAWLYFYDFKIVSLIKTIPPYEVPFLHPWSSPHLISEISGKSGKIFKQSGISKKPVKSRPEYPENLMNQVRNIRKTCQILSGISGKPIKPCPEYLENPENYSINPEIFIL